MKTGSEYLNVLNHGYFRVAVAIPEVAIAHPRVNRERHEQMIELLSKKGALYILFPELSLSAYTIDDYAHQDVLLAACRRELEELVHGTRGFGSMVTVGMPIAFDQRLFNCAVTFCGGKILSVSPKSYLPNYREFYEKRHYVRASDARSREVSLCGQDMIPFGNDIILKLRQFPDVGIHVEVCEDTWVPVPPSTLASLAGATILANASASNITIAKSEYRHELMRNHSAKNLAACLYTSAGSGESSNDLAWDGQGMIYERGELSAETDRFVSGSTYAIVDIDVTALVQDRMRQNSFTDNATDVATRVGADTRSGCRIVHVPYYVAACNRDVYYVLHHSYSPMPFVPSDVVLRTKRCMEIYMMQTAALARRIKSLPRELRKVVIGVSGGRDSTHALLIAVRAFDMLGLPRTNIIACTMPGFGTSDTTLRLARALMNALSVRSYEHPIIAQAGMTLHDIGHDDRVHDICYENVQASERTKHLFALAWQHGGIVLGTGDLSEVAVGWCTYGIGDHMSHYGINIGVPKTLIEYLIAWTADTQFEYEPNVVALLREILQSPVSPELLPPDENNALQETNAKIGPADLRDFFTYYFFRFGFSPYRLCRMAYEVFGRSERVAFDTVYPSYELSTIKHWLGEFLRRNILNQFKRSCLPNGPKVGTVAVSPRGDWRAPSDAPADLWLDDLAAVPDIEPDVLVAWRQSETVHT